MLQLNSKYIKIGFLVLLILTVFIPLLYAFNYVGLNEDDYGRAIWEIEEFGLNFSNWYYTHNGRFINTLLSYLPVYEAPWLQVVLMLNFLATPAVIVFFLKRYFNLISIILCTSDIILIATIIFTLQIISLPLIFEYYYWYAGATAYSFSFLTFILSISFAFGMIQNKKNSFIGALILTVLCAGNNEILILLINYLASLFLIYCYIKRRDLLLQSILLQLTLFITSAIVVFSPGSSHRQGLYEDGGNVISALGQATLYSVSLIFNEFKTFSGVLTLLSILTVAFFIVRTNKGTLRAISLNPVLLIILSFVSVFLLMYVPIYATGGINYNKGRIANMIQILLVFVLFINAINFFIYSQYYITKYRLDIKSEILVVVTAICCLLATYTSSNINNLYSDYENDEFHRLLSDKSNRISLIENSEIKIIVVPSYKGTLFLPQDDMSNNPSHWYNTDYLNYIRYNYDTVVTELIVDYSNQK